MKSHSLKALCAALGVLGLACSPLMAQAVEIQSIEEMRAQVRKSMPAYLANPTEVVDQMLNVELAPPLSKTFDPAVAIKTVFGGASASVASDCRRRATPEGEPDQEDCTVQSGRAAGRGQYLLLRYSKNMGVGNIKHLFRPPVDDAMSGAKLPRASMSDKEAMDMASLFMAQAFGLGTDEVPMPPTGAKTSMVRDLAMVGTNDQGGMAAPIVTQKHVFWQRGWKLGKAYTDGQGMEMTHVPGPGVAMVAIDDTGVVGAQVADWQELRRDPNMTADQAKSVDALIEEIAEDLFNNGVRHVERIDFGLMIDSDWRGTYGLLLPAVQVFVAAVPSDATEEEQAKFAGLSTAGVVKRYSLVESLETEQRR